MQILQIKTYVMINLYNDKTSLLNQQCAFIYITGISYPAIGYMLLVPDHIEKQLF